MAAQPHIITTENKYQPARIYTSGQFDISGLDHEFNRADIDFHELDHSGASYTGHVFMNNPEANAKTARTPENGYAGCFHVFGHGGCFGDAGHCDIPKERSPYDPRPGHPLTKITKTVVATEAVRRMIRAKEPVTITVVPLVTAATHRCNIEEVFHCGYIHVVAYK